MGRILFMDQTEKNYKTELIRLKVFSKWKSSLKINQMYLYVFLLSNYLDSFSRKGCLAMITINIHKRFHTEIFARIVNTGGKGETGGQKMSHAVSNSQVLKVDFQSFS